MSIYVVYNSPEVVLKPKLEFFRTFDVSGFGVDGNIIPFLLLHSHPTGRQLALFLSIFFGASTEFLS